MSFYIAKNHKRWYTWNHATRVWNNTNVNWIINQRKKCPNTEQYAEFLQDGKILAEVLAAACPTPLGQAKVLSQDPTDRERIEKVIYDLFDFGVQPSNLFEPDDLLKKRNIPQVGY